MVIFSAAITAWRCYEFLVNPYLRAEDGAKVFAYFYDHRAATALFRIKAGYTPFLPNLLGWIAVRLPPRSIPYFLTAAPATLAAITYSVFGAPSYRRYVPSDGLRATACLAMLIAPMGGHFLICNTDYSIWNALLLLLLLVVIPMPHAGLNALLFSAIVCVLIWTSPLSIAALPATLIWLWRDKTRFHRLLHGTLALAQGAHIWFGTRPQNATFAKGEGSLHRLAEVIFGTFSHIARDVISETVYPWRTGTQSFDFTLAGLFALGMLACALLPRRHRVASRAFYLWLAYSTIAPMALVLLARAEPGIRALRYLYVSKGFVTIATCMMLAQLVVSVTAWSAQLVRLGLALSAVTSIVYFTKVSSVTGRLSRFNQPDPDNGAIVARFFSDLAQAERKHGGHCNIYLRCKKKHGDWPFLVDTRKKCE